MPSFRSPEAILGDIARLTGHEAGRAGGSASVNVSLCGPEPFLHPALPHIVHSCVTSGVARLRIETDGAYLTEGDNALAVLGAGVMHVSVRLLAGDPQTHDSLTGDPGSFQRAVQGMRRFVQAASDVGSRRVLSGYVPVCRHNHAEAAAAVGSFVLAQADHVLLDVVDESLVPEAAAPWLAAACDTGMVNRLWVRVEGVPIGALPDHGLHLSPPFPHGTPDRSAARA